MYRKRRISSAAVAALIFLPLTLPASATPADDARARAASIARQREKILVDAEMVNERRLATAIEVDRLNRDQDDLQVELAVKDQTLQDLSGQAKAMTIQAYVTGTESSGLGIVVDATTANEIPVREGYAGALLGSSQDVLDQMQSARDDTQRAGKQLKTLLDDKVRLQASLDADQVRLTKAEEDLAALAKKTDTEIVTLVQQEQDRLRQEAAERAAAKALVAASPPVTATRSAALAPKAALVAPAAGTPAARVASAPAAPNPAAAKPTTTAKPATPPAPATPKPTTKPTTKPSAQPAPAAGTPPPSVDEQPAPDDTPEPSATKPAATTAPPRQTYPAPSPGAAIAVAEALKQLGKSYIFGAAGPENFDCSGLTQWAWAKAGVSMDHFTGSQWNAFPHVPIDQIQPGDLVFVRVDLGHMGMYIGGGEYIHAPRTGDVVKIAKLSSARIAGVVRPG